MVDWVLPWECRTFLHARPSVRLHCGHVWHRRCLCHYWRHRIRLATPVRPFGAARDEEKGAPTKPALECPKCRHAISFQGGISGCGYQPSPPLVAALVAAPFETAQLLAEEALVRAYALGKSGANFSALARSFCTCVVLVQIALCILGT